jgi:hypothetical protein
MANGFNVAEMGHTVQLLPPQNISGGIYTPPFSMKNAEHVSIIVQFGAFGASAPTSLQLLLLQTVAQSPASVGVALPFRYYWESIPGLGNDLLSPPVYSTTAGLTVFNKATNNYLIIELDAAEIYGGQANLQLSDSDNLDYPYISVAIANGSNAIQCAIVAILSGVRFQYQGGQTVTT